MEYIKINYSPATDYIQITSVDMSNSISSAGYIPSSLALSKILIIQEAVKDGSLSSYNHCLYDLHDRALAAAKNMLENSDKPLLIYDIIEKRFVKSDNSNMHTIAGVKEIMDRYSEFVESLK